MRLHKSEEVLIDAEDNFREPLIEATTQALVDGYNVLIAGANGMGRTTFLIALARSMSTWQPQPRMVSCLEPEVLETIPRIPCDAVLLVDDLEFAQLDTLQALQSRELEGGISVSMLNTNTQTTPYEKNIARLTAEGQVRSDKTRPLKHFTLDPLPSTDIQRLIHQSSRTLIDTVSAEAIVTLSKGRPEWAMDLLVCARARNLAIDPLPRLTHLAAGHTGLPSVQTIVRTISEIAETAAATAIVLSEISALDVQSIQSLVGEEIVTKLLRHGVLVEHSDQEHFIVPQIVATALRPQVSPEALQSVRIEVAHQLAGLESAGIPLSEQDRLFVFMTLPTDRLVDLGHDVYRDIVLRLVSFGTAPRLRAVMLRSASLPTLEPMTRVAMLTVFGQHDAALSLFDSLEQSEDEAGSSLLFLRTLIEREHAAQPQAVPLDETLSPEARLFALWNSDEPINAYTKSLQSLMDEHSRPDLALLAETLIDLESAWQTRISRKQSWLTSGEPLPTLGTTSLDGNHYQHQTLLVAQALTLLLSGDLSLRADELFAQADRFPLADHERLWLTHLIGAYEALMCGDMPRCAMEWSLMQDRLPRFLPYRLNTYISLLARVMETVTQGNFDPLTSSTATHHGRPIEAYRLALYLAGKYDTFVQRDNFLSTHPNALPIVKLAGQHLKALAHNNPKELLRVADQHFSLRMWLPSARAYIEAKDIYIRRRSSSKVRHCDERIQMIAESAAETLPWFSGDMLSVQAPRLLTKREEEVSELLSEGLSNSDIAALLGCTTRTVESHVASARAKLGASNRHTLADMYLAQRDMIDASQH